MTKNMQILLGLCLAALVTAVIMGLNSEAPPKSTAKAEAKTSGAISVSDGNRKRPHRKNPPVHDAKGITQAARDDAASTASAESDDEKAIQECALCYRTTHYKSLVELTMDELNLIEVCKKYGIYHEAGR
jgi:hypothetical protein